MLSIVEMSDSVVLGEVEGNDKDGTVGNTVLCSHLDSRMEGGSVTEDNMYMVNWGE